jgi:hypothetical protein
MFFLSTQVTMSLLKDNLFLSALTFCGLIGLVGCQPAFDPLIDIVDAKSSTVKVDDYTRAISLVRSSKGYANDEFENSVSQNLNRWATKLKSDPKGVGVEWKLDESVAPIVAEFEQYPIVKNIDELTFAGVDSHYLRQSDWCEAIVKRVTTVKHPLMFELFRMSAGDQVATAESATELNELVKALNPDVSTDQLKKLVDSIKLFDWVVRNTQLEAEYTPTEEEINNGRLSETPTGKPWSNGIRGTGYNSTPFQLLTYGRGDYVERAKLFIKLLEHNDTTAVMLTVGEMPWTVGVEIGGQLYLFDTKLGLPIPKDKFGSVATLADVRKNPEILNRLDLTLDESIESDNKYWVKSDKLGDIAGLIYVAPESVSYRMRVLEQTMVGDKLLLTTDLTKTRATLAKIENLPTKIWDIEFKNLAYRWTLRDALIRSKTDDSLPAKLFWYYDNEAYVDMFESYRTSRNMFAHGLFEADLTADEYNVIENFYLLMYDDKKIDELATNTPLLLRLGILQTKNQNAKQFQERIQSVQSQMRLVRRDAGLFLAQSHFDNGNIGTAGNWLERISVKEDALRWSNAIRYLMGRSFESRREYDRAIAELKKSNGPDRHGNLLRMRYLKTLAAVTESSTSASKASSVSTESKIDEADKK